MGKSDVEMEDAEKLPCDSRENIQDHERKSPDTNGESNQENFPSEAELAVAGDANNSELGGEDLNEFTDEAKQETTLNSEVEDQISPKGEVIESMNSLGSVGVQINAISENMEQINTKSNAEDQTDAENELVEQSPTNGVVKEEKSTDNDMEGGDHVKNVIEENLSMGDCVENVAREENNIGNADSEKYTAENTQVQTDKLQGEYEEMEDEVNVNEGEAAKGELKEHGNEVFPASPVPNENVMTGTSVKHEIDDCSLPNQREPATANSLVTYPHSRDGDHSGQKGKGVFTLTTLPPMAESDDGTLEDQAAFMKELESFYRERAMDFKPPKFYGQPLNCLKLWRATIRLGGYDRVTGCKLWRQVGESFHPPKTCTTVSWTFRIFYEKSLLEFERHKIQSGELQLPVAAVPEASVVQNEGGYQGSTPVSSGRARRDSAARAMQGWHVQRLNGNGEVAEPVIKDKNLNNMAKREKNLKSIGSVKQKRPNEVENSVKAARTETYTQLVTSVVDVGPPADWVKINVRQLNDCFEVYALVPGLLREEVRVQSDPAGRLVITGQPEQVENPWGITPFKKVVSLPARINPLQTSAVVSLHGRLFVRVPFE